MMPQVAATLSNPFMLAGWLAAGLLLGVIYFSVVRRSADLLVSGGAIAFAISLVAFRLALLVTGLYVAAVCGTLPLLAAAGGVLVGRGIVLRRKPGGA